MSGRIASVALLGVLISTSATLGENKTFWAPTYPKTAAVSGKGITIKGYTTLDAGWQIDKITLNAWEPGGVISQYNVPTVTKNYEWIADKDGNWVEETYVMENAKTKYHILVEVKIKHATQPTKLLWTSAPLIESK